MKSGSLSQPRRDLGRRVGEEPVRHRVGKSEAAGAAQAVSDLRRVRASRDAGRKGRQGPGCERGECLRHEAPVGEAAEEGDSATGRGNAVTSMAGCGGGIRSDGTEDMRASFCRLIARLAQMACRGREVSGRRDSRRARSHYREARSAILKDLEARQEEFTHTLPW